MSQCDDKGDDDDDDVARRESEDHEQHWFWIGLNRRNPMDNGSWKWSDGLAVSVMQPDSVLTATKKKRKAFSLFTFCVSVHVPELWPLLL